MQAWPSWPRLHRRQRLDTTGRGRIEALSFVLTHLV